MYFVDWHDVQRSEWSDLGHTPLTELRLKLKLNTHSVVLRNKNIS